MLWDPNKDVDLSKPSLKGLAYLLRHRELWPKGFKWDYDWRGTCALGLADRIWNYPDLCPEANLLQHDGYSYLFYGRFIGDACTRAKVDWSEIKPETIADKIEELLAKGGE